MSYNYSKLNGKIREVCGNQLVFAQKMGLSEHTISMKLNSKVSWKQPEIERACTVLDIQRHDIPAYFFDLKVQY
jgi:hypothetical protein